MGEAKLFGVHLWFRLHVLLQLTGTGLFIAGFVYDHALKEFPSTLIGGDVGIAHQNLGIAVLAMAAAQVRGEMGKQAHRWLPVLEGGSPLLRLCVPNRAVGRGRWGN